MTGVLEVLAFPEAFARLETVLKSGAPLLLRGRVNVEEAGTRVAVQEAQSCSIEVAGAAVRSCACASIWAPWTKDCSIR